MSDKAEKSPNFIIKKGFDLLQAKKAYSQRDIVNKLKALDVQVSVAHFNNIISGKRVGQKTILIVEQGVMEIIKKEIDFYYNEVKTDFEWCNTPSWQEEIVSVMKKVQDKNSFLLHENGRLALHHKTDFINTANKELIELGVRMKSFSDYFYFRNDAEYKNHIFALLERGINIKSYLIDPTSQQASLYFRDRTKWLEEEIDSPRVIDQVIIRLKKLQKEIESHKFQGKMEMYTYNHIPNNHFLIVDPETPQARMIVSHYLYGITRANCPVMEFEKKDNRVLFRKYYNSFKMMVDGAKRI